jgi:hypothetical protein
MAGSQQLADGVTVIVTDAGGVEHEALARSVIEGRFVDGILTHDFPVVWVDIPRWDGQGTARVPWPLTADRRAG